MKTVEKRRLTKTQRLAIILSCVLAFLVIAGVVLSIVYANLGNGGDEETLPDIRESLGEALYSGSPVAYERLEENEIQYLVVKNEKGKFDLTRPDADGYFYLGYDDGTTEGTFHIPPIVYAEGGFDYESLYAIENNDGYGRFYMLSYLCSAIGTVYFTERIDLPTDTAERDAVLASYGLKGEGATPTEVSFAYAKRGEDGKLTGKTGAYTIMIGNAALNGDGYYFTVSDSTVGDRGCVYYTKYSSFKYAKLGFESFVKGALIAAGLASDKSFEPLLTSKFTEWKNEYHEDGRVEESSIVLLKANVTDALRDSAEYKVENNLPLEQYLTAQDERFDLSKIGSDEDLRKIAAALVGREVGAQDPICITLLADRNGSADSLIDFGNKNQRTYRYVISSIDSVIYADGSESAAAGTTVADAAKIRVSYDCYIDTDTTKKNGITMRSVIDLDSALLSDADEEKLRAASVGALSEAIEIEIVYTKENAIKSTESIVISNIVGVYTPAGKTQTKVDDKSTVVIKYYAVVDGVAGEKKTMSISMSDLKAKPDPSLPGLYDLLMGQKSDKEAGYTSTQNRSITLYTKEHYHELMCGFKSYEITEILGYITSEEIVSFRFVNELDRDPFYGESVYENLTGQYGVYGVDADNCQSVLRLLGGLSEDTTASLGLSGTTVSVGLTNKDFVEMGLYAYTIYFELPRDISIETIKVEGEEDAEHYSAWDKLGFTLYISEVNLAKGTRLVYSDLYDVVAEVDASVFEFLGHSFVDFWARRSLVMLDLGNVETFKLEFFMEDVSGSYDFEINHMPVWVNSGTSEVSTTEIKGWTEQEYWEIYVTESGDYMTDTKVHQFTVDKGIDDGRVALHAVYNTYMGGGKDLVLPNSVEWVGVSNFMLAFQVMQLTGYEGSLTEAEQDLSAGKKPLLMRMTIGLDPDVPNAKSYDYVYEFYRISDRKVMVKTYMQSPLGDKASEASELYISTFAFKKMVGAYLTVLNAGEVDGEIPYADEK